MGSAADGRRRARTRAGFCPGGLPGQKRRALRAAWASLRWGSSYWRQLGVVRWAGLGRDPAPQAGCLFIAGVSAAMKNEQAFLCDLCASVVKNLEEKLLFVTSAPLWRTAFRTKERFRGYRGPGKDPVAVICQEHLNPRWYQAKVGIDMVAKVSRWGPCGSRTTEQR
jgi:hypothetical protein